MAEKVKKLDSSSLKSSLFLNITKGVFWSISFSLLAILIFAFIIKFSGLSDGAIQPINQIIKGVSILLGCFIIGKKVKQNGWLVGLIVGFFYTILAFIIFSILASEFRFGLNLLNDIVFGSLMGLIAGIICISLRNK